MARDIIMTTPEDIVTKLARMPIAEWEEARLEIIKLRGLVGTAAVGVVTVTENTAKDVIAIGEAELNSLKAKVAELEKKLSLASAEAAVGKRVATELAKANEKIKALEGRVVGAMESGRQSIVGKISSFFNKGN